MKASSLAKSHFAQAVRNLLTQNLVTLFWTWLLVSVLCRFKKLLYNSIKRHLTSLSYLNTTSHSLFTVLTGTGNDVAVRMNVLTALKKEFPLNAVIKATSGRCCDRAIVNTIFTVGVKSSHYFWFIWNAETMHWSILGWTLLKRSIGLLLIEKYESVKWCVVGKPSQTRRSVSFSKHAETSDVNIFGTPMAAKQPMMPLLEDSAAISAQTLIQQ